MSKFQLILKKSDTFIKDSTWEFESDLDKIEINGIIDIVTNKNYPNNELYLIENDKKYLYSYNDTKRSLIDLTKSYPAKFYIPNIGLIEIYKIVRPNPKINSEYIVCDEKIKFIGNIKVDDPNIKIEISMKKLYDTINAHLPSLFNIYKQISIKFDNDSEEFTLPLDKICEDAILTKFPDYTNNLDTGYSWCKSVQFEDVAFCINCDVYNGSGYIMNLCNNVDFSNLAPYNKFKFLQKIMCEIEECEHPVVYNSHYHLIHNGPLKSINTDCYVNGIHMYFGLDKVNKIQRPIDALPFIEYRDVICYEKDNQLYRIPVKYKISFNHIDIAYDIYTYGIMAAKDLTTNIPTSTLTLANQVSNIYKCFQGISSSIQITVSTSLLI